jgi:hypothetical protein
MNNIYRTKTKEKIIYKLYRLCEMLDREKGSCIIYIRYRYIEKVKIYLLTLID